MVNLGDQVVALKNSISLSHIDTTANVINDASEQEVLLKFVKHLASLQNQQQHHSNSSDKCATQKNNEIIGRLINNSQQTADKESVTTIDAQTLSLSDETAESSTCASIAPPSLASATAQTPIIINKHDFYDKVTATTKNTSNNSIQYKDSANQNNNYYYQKVYQDGTDRTGYFTHNALFIDSNKGKTNYIGNGNTNSQVKIKTERQQQQQQQTDNNMGSNVSRHTVKGLSGRRTQSSGDLAHGNHDKPNGSHYTPNNNNSEHLIENEAAAAAAASSLTKDKCEQNNTNHRPTTNDATTTIDSCRLDTEQSQLMSVKRSDRNKFFGSLPILDSDEMCEENFRIGNGKTNPNESTTYVTIERRNDQHDQHHQPQPNQQYSFSSRNSISEKDSTSSSFNASNPMRSIYANKANMNLKLPINRTNCEGCDQGYGSERSPEDELPPTLPILSIPYQAAHQQPQWDHDKVNGCDFNFITKDSCFVVQVAKGPRGLGLSVCGGIETNAAFRGVIRIKRLFPNQSAWCTGMLQPGDILLEANGTRLTGLTNHEALEVLRTASNLVTLTVCRPRDEHYRKLSPPTEAPKPPQRMNHHQPNNLPLEPLSPIQTHFSGEFEIIMVKQQGSLGFTLRKEDESVLGHYVRALVREPATTDGRIKPGDKIVAVNDVPLCPMTHEEAVIFLRQASDRVKLRLYRDNAQTPIASISPSGSEHKSVCNTGKQKTCLRPEAMNLLIDLAHKNRKQNCDSDSTGSSVQSSTASPRRLRRNINKHNLSNNSNISQSENEKTDSNSLNYPNQKYTVTTQSSSVCSDSETSTMSQCSFIAQPSTHQRQEQQQSLQQNTNEILNSTFVIQNPSHQQDYQQYSHHNYYPSNSHPNYDQDSEYYNEEELWKMMDADEYNCSGSVTDSSNRPSYLELAGNSGCTPIVSRKPRFQFSAANGYELNNLDNEALDAPVYTAISGNAALKHQPYPDENGQDFTSLPCDAILVACRTENGLPSNGDSFRHKNPMYQSAHVQLLSKANTDEYDNTEYGNEKGTKNLLKWKGVMFGTDEGDNKATAAEAAANTTNAQTPASAETTTTTSSEPDSSCATIIEANPLQPEATNEANGENKMTVDEQNHKIINVELNRGWNSRLGFSLQSNESQQTFISAIYSDSVAAKDGRLKVGDQILMVNDESVETMPTSDIIDLLRIIRGSIVLLVKRRTT